VPYLADKDLLRLARAMDPAATQQPNVAQATLDLTIAKEKIFLFLKYKSVQINETLIDANEPLRVEGGQYFIPLRSLLVILDHYQGVKSNIPELLTAPAAPPVPTPAVPPPTGVVPAPPIGVSTPPLPASAPGLGLAPPPLPDSLQADPRDISEALLSVMGTDTAENATFRGSLKLTTAPLIARRFIVLDPQTGPNALGSTADAPPSDLIFQIATRCRDLLAQAQTVEVYVVTKSASENPTPDQRLASLNTVGGKALVSLRLDWSPFEDNRGYRIFTAHESVDSEGLESLRPIAATPGAIPPPPAPAYLPYDRISLVLAHLLDLQMKRINRIPPASSQSIKQAPFYLLKRTGMPAATLSLGYWSNPADRSYLSTQDFVEESAHALARTIVLYDRWLRQIQEEPGA
jgi:N-acetylmuramoyl-L-alanine amidase